MRDYSMRSIEVNHRCSLKSARHLLQVDTGDIPDRTDDHSSLVTYDCDVAAGRSESRVCAESVLPGEVLIDTAASVIAGGKRALIVNAGDLWEKRTTKTTAATSGCCTQCVKGRPAAPSVALALMIRRTRTKRSRQAILFNIIPNPF